MKLSALFPLLSLGIALVAAACERPAAASPAIRAAARETTTAVPDGGSALGELHAFRAAAGARVTRLGDASPTRDVLVRRFAAALDAGDTTSLRRMALTRAEFAWLYYPESPQSRPPYDLEPELMWAQIQTRSSRGLTRAIREYAGTLGYVRHECETSPMRLGTVTLYNACRVVHRYNGKPLAEPLFGSIIERDGLFKFVGFSNRL